MYKYIHNWDIPFTEGENTLLAISGEVKDLSSIKFTLHPYKYNNESREFKTLSLLLGTNRYYKDPETKVVWMPDQPYREGSFGHIGGVPYKLPNSGRTPFGTDLDILLTDNDPIFQTQVVGIKEYRFDVPIGKYEVTLNFAEFEGVASKELAYNLSNGNETTIVSAGERVFDVVINNQLIISKLNIAKDYGVTQAVSIKTPVIVKDDKGITVEFNAIKNKTILNSIQLRRVF